MWNRIRGLTSSLPEPAFCEGLSLKVPDKQRLLARTLVTAALLHCRSANHVIRGVNDLIGPAIPCAPEKFSRVMLRIFSALTDLLSGLGGCSPT